VLVVFYVCKNNAKLAAKKKSRWGFIGLRGKGKKPASAAGRKFYIAWKNRHSFRMVLQDKL